MNSEKMLFFVDAMLGHLATWLRLLGFDSRYEPDIEDDEVLRIVEGENRILLTSDMKLHETAIEHGLQSMLVRGDVDEEVALVLHRFQIKPVVDPSRARCSKCNGKLIELHGAEKERVRSLVHERTFSHYDVFWLCENCKGVYFQGGYWANILKYMKRISELIQNMET